MKEAILEGKKHFVVKEVPEPSLEEDEVLIKVHFCGICGSDLHTYIEGIPARYGHEFSGDIVKVGAGVEGWQVGDRVTVESISSCGKCRWCLSGRMELCDTFYDTWGNRAGGFATYTKAKAGILHRIPESVSYEAAALTEPTAVALHAVRLSRMGPGDTVAVLGLGPLGQIVARLAKASGAVAVYASEVSGSRLDLAQGAVDEVIDARAVNPVERIHQLTHGRGADVVFETAGAAITVHQSLAAVRKGGTIVMVGVSMQLVDNLPSSNIVLNELTIKGAMCYLPGEYAMALDLIASKRINISPLITAIMPLDEINAAFEMAVTGEGGKILIAP